MLFKKKIQKIWPTGLLKLGHSGIKPTALLCVDQLACLLSFWPGIIPQSSWLPRHAVSPNGTHSFTMLKWFLEQTSKGICLNLRQSLIQMQYGQSGVTVREISETVSVLLWLCGVVLTPLLSLHGKWYPKAHLNACNGFSIPLGHQPPKACRLSATWLCFLFLTETLILA